MDAEERFHKQKNGIRQVLHPYETQRPTRINNYELDNEICFNQRSDCCEDNTKWKPEIYQIPRREAEVEEQMQKWQSKNSSQRL